MSSATAAPTTIPKTTSTATSVAKPRGAPVTVQISAPTVSVTNESQWQTVCRDQDNQMFFYVIACTAILGFVVLFFMDEPKGHMAEIREDGSVELIELN